LNAPRTIHGTAPQYLTAQWTPVSETASRQHLRSAASHQLTVPPHRRVTYGGQAFAVADPSTWNSLPKRLRDPSNSVSVFSRLLKTVFLLLRVLIQRVRGFGEDVLCKLTFYITLYGCNLSRGWVRIIPWTDQRRGTNRHYTDPRGRAWSSHYLECSAMSGPHPIYIKHQG